MKKIKIIDHSVTATLCDEKYELIETLKKEFAKYGVEKDEYELETLIEKSNYGKETSAFEMAYQLEELTDALFSLLVTGNAFNEETAKNLWCAIKKDEDETFKEFYSTLKSVMNERRI